MSCDNIDNKKKIKTCTSTTTKTAKSKIADESEFDYSKLVIPKEILRKMLIRENELRLCEETQKEYFRIESQPQMPGDWLDYTAKLQEQVIEEVVREMCFSFFSQLCFRLYSLDSKIIQLQFGN